MKLLDHLTHSGDVLFRWRSYLPLLLLPLFLLSLGPAPSLLNSRTWDEAWGLGCLAVSMTGLAIRVFTIGTAPAGTSERSTSDLFGDAAVLNKTGAYSVVRHPLYVGNSLVALGLALYPRTWFLPLIIVLASLLYHERIAAREEQFLEERFGDEFRLWAARVPAMVPGPGRYRKSEAPFRWTKVMSREFHALFVIGSAFFVLNLVRDRLLTGQFRLDPLWTGLLAATGMVFVVMTALKKWTGLLEAGNDQAARAPRGTGSGA